MKPELIKGGTHSDHRGILQFINDFDMSQVKRFYTITHTDTSIRRGWRGHQIEQRWFYVIEGEFEMELIEVDDWHHPNPNLPIQTLKLSATTNEVLHVPAGFATCIRATISNSKVVLFADYGAEHAKSDDYLWASDYFNTKK